MSINIEVDKEKELTILTASDLVTNEQMFEAQKAFYNDHPTRLELWDMSGANLLKITSSGMQLFVDRASQLGSTRRGGKTAVLVKMSLQYGLARMAQTFGEFASLPFEFRIFKTRDEAMSWLGVDSKGH